MTLLPRLTAYHAFSIILLGSYENILVLVIYSNFIFKSLGQWAVRA